MRYVLRRIVFFIMTLWVAVTINFFIPRMMPGNPAQAMIAKFVGLGQQVSPATLHAIEVMLGISHQSLFQQYVQYLGQVVTFNFGTSYTQFPYKVTYLISQALPWTLGLVGLSTILSFVIGTLIGIFAAWKRNGRFDSAATTISAFTRAFPYFWLGLLMVYLIGFKFHMMPMAGAFANGETPQFTWAFIGQVVHHGILPALTIVISSLGGWIVGMRNNMINVLTEDYVLLGEAKGLKERKIAIGYVARNAMLPTLTGFAMSLGFVVAGSLLTEIVFSYPGVGDLLYNAVINQDYPLMQGIFLIIVVCVIVANFLADLAYLVVDPRTRVGSSSN